MDKKKNNNNVIKIINKQVKRRKGTPLKPMEKHLRTYRHPVMVAPFYCDLRLYSTLEVQIMCGEGWVHVRQFIRGLIILKFELDGTNLPLTAAGAKTRGMSYCNCEKVGVLSIGKVDIVLDVDGMEGTLT